MDRRAPRRRGAERMRMIGWRMCLSTESIGTVSCVDEALSEQHNVGHNFLNSSGQRSYAAFVLTRRMQIVYRKKCIASAYSPRLRSTTARSGSAVLAARHASRE